MHEITATHFHLIFSNQISDTNIDDRQRERNGAPSDHLRHCEILREIIFYGWNNRLHKFQKDYQIHVHAEHFAALLDRLDDLLHDVRVPKRRQKQKKQINTTRFWLDSRVVSIDQYALAWMHRCHVGTGQVGMRLHCDSFLGMILAHIFVHLLDSQRMPILIVANDP